MPSRKKNKALAAPNTELDQKAVPGVFPFSSYVYVVGSHAALLAFSAFFLPHVPKTLSSSSSSTSLLESLTRDPVLTVAWICAGATPVQAWWAGWMKRWWIQCGSKTEQREWQRGRLSVSLHVDPQTTVRAIGYIGTEACFSRNCCNLHHDLCLIGAFRRSTIEACFPSPGPFLFGSFLPIVTIYAHIS
jgi:hypothetical protein